MELAKVLRIGNFDRVVIKGNLEPIYKMPELQLYPGVSLGESIDMYGAGRYCHIASLKINVIGEVTDSDDGELNKNRIQDGIKLLEEHKNTREYSIANIHLLLLKNNYSMPFGCSNSSSIVDMLSSISTIDNERNIILAAYDLSEYIAKMSKQERGDIGIVIVDKVYVHKQFRRCKISSWVHSNMANLVNTFALTFPSAAILACGDFSNEANKAFGLTDEQYLELLRNHYSKEGYNEVLDIKKYFKNSDVKNLMFKSFIEL